jgi:ADP-ribose pyrophosphatase YjhB (NUDIX family)
MSLTPRRQIANFIRRFPFLMAAAHYAFRIVRWKYSLGVVGIVWNDQHEVLLVEHVFHPRLPWGLPGGWVDFNEEPATAVIRELREELQVVVDEVRIVMIRKTQYHHLDIAFECRTASPVGRLSRELLGCRWFHLNDLPRMHKFHYDAIMLSSQTRGAQ